MFTVEFGFNGYFGKFISLIFYIMTERNNEELLKL